MDDDLVMVYRGGGGPPQAAVISSALEAAGIENAVQGGGLEGSYPVTVGALGEFSIWVGAADQEMALEVLRSEDDV